MVDIVPTVYTVLADEVEIMINEKFNHIPVLLDESIENLNIKPDGIYIDGTMGGARTQLSYCKKTI